MVPSWELDSGSLSGKSEPTAHSRRSRRVRPRTSTWCFLGRADKIPGPSHPQAHANCTSKCTAKKPQRQNQTKTKAANTVLEQQLILPVGPSQHVQWGLMSALPFSGPRFLQGLHFFKSPSIGFPRDVVINKLKPGSLKQQKSIPHSSGGCSLKPHKVRL